MIDSIVTNMNNETVESIIWTSKNRGIHCKIISVAGWKNITTLDLRNSYEMKIATI